MKEKIEKKRTRRKHRTDFESPKGKQTVTEEKKNDVICIIGMHRSGTSMVARLLNLCGLDLGPPEQFMPPNESNPLGYFENENFTYKIDDALLAHFGGSWDNPPLFKEDWEYNPSIEQIVLDAKSLLQTFSNSSQWGWKDPRATILLPFWKSLIPNLRFVICVRSPLEVSKSLAKRDKISIQKGVYLWNQYMRAAIRDTEGCPRIFIFYEDFFKDTPGEINSEINRLVEFCGLQKPDDLSSLHDTISSELKHHTSETLELLNEDKVITEYKLFYIGLRALTTEGFAPSTSNRTRDDLASENISKFFKLLEQFHDENEMAQLQSALADKEQQITNFSITMLIQQQALAQREKQVAQLIAHQEVLSQKLEGFQAVLNEKEQQVTQLTEERERLAQEATQLQTTVQNQQQAQTQKEEQVVQLTAQQEALTQQLEGLQTSLHQKEEQMDQLQTTVQDQQQAQTQKEEQVVQLTAQQDALTQQLEGLQTSLHQKEEQMDQLQATVQDQQQAQTQTEKEQQVTQLTAEQDRLIQETTQLRATVQVQQQALNTIYVSLGWKIVSRIWKLTDMLLPLESKRREIARLVYNLPSLLTPRNLGRVVTYSRLFGPTEALKEVSKKLRSDVRYVSKGADILPAIKDEDVLSDATVPYENVTISVVIPVKNAGADFRHLLSVITDQKGFKDVEIVVVDSGSTDRSLEISEEFGAKIIQILPDEFSHSYARNLAAEHASGDYLLFTVQDALLPSDSWLHELFSVIKKNDVVAVSCVEFPREDADLFYRALSWNHNKFMEVDKQDRIMSKPDDENHITLRKNGQLSNVACLISRDAFMKYKFRGDYAEDLDLGVRLIKDGYKLALLSSTRIIHSHNRPAYYYLKRGYVDDLLLSQILPDRPLLVIESGQPFRDIIFTYEVVKSIVCEKLERITVPCTIGSLSSIVMEKFRTAADGNYSVTVDMANNDYIDSKFRSFLENLYDRQCSDGENGAHYDGILISAMGSFTKVILEYMDETYELIDDYVLEEFKYCLYKEFASHCGLLLCSSIIRGSESTKKMIDEIDEDITKAGI